MTWEDDLADTALNVVPPLVIGEGVVRLAFGHPAFWMYLVGVALAGAGYGTACRLLRKHRGCQKNRPAVE
jgi:hypothetical protein